MEYGSVWRRAGKEYPRLEGDIERDIVVVGGGIAGFLTAFRLTEAGRKVTLIEADRLFSGTTGRTTAKITCNQGNVYAELYRRYGRSMTSLYYRSQVDAMRAYADLVKEYGIDCDWEEGDGYIFSRGNHCRPEKAYKALRNIGAECELVHDIRPMKACCALKMSGQYMFDPLKFLHALPADFEIFERSRVTEIDAEKRVLRTGGGSVKANVIVIATRYPVINSHGMYFMKLRQSASYTIAVTGRHVEDMYLDDEAEGLSLRPFAGGTILGGCDHRTGRRKRGGRFAELERNAAKLFPGCEVTDRWFAEDVMTFDGLPMVGEYAKGLENVYVATGFNKWGMTNAMAAAGILTDLITGADNPYAGVFSPQRGVRGAFFASLVNAAVNIAGMIAGALGISFVSADEIPSGEGRIARINGETKAVYRDEGGRLHVTDARCPHMKCRLKWNAETRTWDCPCHGSRFDADGRLLDPPAVKNNRRVSGESGGEE